MFLCYGKYSSFYIKGAIKAGLSTTVCFQCKDTTETANKLNEMAKKGDCILFKASRGMGAEKIIEKFFERWSS
jgi:UDP-N-acetylmuramyl pentapeptide synthase